MARTKKQPKVATAAPVVERTAKFLKPGEYKYDTANDSRHPDMDPEYADHVANLAFSIFTEGQRQPADAYTDADGNVVLCAGLSRGRAVEQIVKGFDHIDPASGDKVRVHNPEATLFVMVDPAARDANTAFLNSLAENIKRRNLNPMQEAAAHGRLRGPGFEWSETRIANHFGYDNTNRVALLRELNEKLTDKYRDYVAAGRLAPYAARDLLAVPVEERDTVLASARFDADDPHSKFDGSVIREYLRNKNAPVTPDAGENDGGAGGDEGEETGGGKGGKKKGGERAIPKRNAGDWSKLVEGYKQDEERDARVEGVLVAVQKWFNNAGGEKALVNAIVRALDS